MNTVYNVPANAFLASSVGLFPSPALEVARLGQGLGQSTYAQQDLSQVATRTPKFSNGLFTKPPQWQTATDQTHFPKWKSGLFAEVPQIRLSSDQLPPSSTPPAAGSDAPAGASSNGGGGDGKVGKRGVDLVQQIIGKPQTQYGYRIALIKYALDRGYVNEKELKQFFDDNIGEKRFSSLRLHFFPDLMTGKELIEKALEEVSKGEISNSTKTKLIEREQNTLEDPSYHNLKIFLDGRTCGFVMDELMYRFFKSCKPEALGWEGPSLYSAGIHREQTVRIDKPSPYEVRVRSRKDIVEIMRLVNEGLATIYFEKMAFGPFVNQFKVHFKGGLRSRDDDEKDAVEAKRAATDAIIQLGKRTLIEKQAPFIDNLFVLNDKHSISSDNRERFELLGSKLKLGSLHDEITDDEKMAFGQAVVERAMSEHRAGIDNRFGGRVTDWIFQTIGHVGEVVAKPLLSEINNFLDANPDKTSERDMVTLESMLRGLNSVISIDSEKHHIALSELKKGTLLLEILATNLRISDLMQGETDDSMENLCGIKDVADRIIVALIQNGTRWIEEAGEEGSTVKDSLDLWMQQQVG